MQKHHVASNAFVRCIGKAESSFRSKRIWSHRTATGTSTYQIAPACGPIEGHPQPPSPLAQGSLALARLRKARLRVCARLVCARPLAMQVKSGPFFYESGTLVKSQKD